MSQDFNRKYLLGFKFIKKSYFWLFASLLLIFLPACGMSPRATNVPTDGGSIINAPQPSNTITSAFVNTPSQATPAFTVTHPPQANNPQSIQTITPQPSATIVSSVVFAAIGDYGSGNKDEGDVAHLILSWQPDFVITLGDNNYPNGSASFIDEAIGQFFHSYIYPYQGSYGAGAEVNRFFPSIGNHDTYSDNGQPYLDYFSLPGNERYYDFTWGPLHLFAIDNIEIEPDGVGESSVQAQWLKAGLASSTSPWNIVYMHCPPYSSGTHGSTDWARWPYASWGADAVLAGHDHTYERLVENGIPYFVNGLGGAGRYDFEEIVDGSQVRYNADYGAMRVEATDTRIIFEFIARSGEVVDKYELDN
jgi:tartrate-resistant acid phosphatase type 5